MFFTAKPEIPVAPQPASKTSPHILTAGEQLAPEGTLYTDFFKFLDTHLNPNSYFEIGTHLGSSVKQFRCDAVCVDPHFMLEQDVLVGRRRTMFFQMTSDEFFSTQDLRHIYSSGPDICFLDGMHRSEYLLRDFINTERVCRPRSIVFMHDCLPVNARMALRTHELGDESEGHWKHAWTGDVWKIVPLLASLRPDLRIFYLDCAPTGLVAVTNLDPCSTLLNDQYSQSVDKLRDLDLATFSIQRLWEHLPVISSRSLVSNPQDLTLFLDFN